MKPSPPPTPSPSPPPPPSPSPTPSSPPPPSPSPTPPPSNLHALARALAEARAAEARARQDREEVLSEPAFQPAFEALKRVDGYIRACAEQASMQEGNVRRAIEQRYAETGEGPDTPGLGIQWRSQPAYHDETAVDWLAKYVPREWLRRALREPSLRKAFESIARSYNLSFIDFTSKRLVPTISDALNARLEAAANPPPESMQEWQARDRRKHGEAISKLVAEQWGEKP